MSLNPKTCGKWDGCGLWVEWDPVDRDRIAKYDLEIRYRLSGKEWPEEWMRVIPRQGRASHWAVIPTWKESYECQARVRTEGGEWEIAQEVTFARCTALFEFSTTKYEQHYQPGTKFHSQVDAAACTYLLLEEIEVKPGAPVRVRLEADGESGYFQLDYPGHFDLKPSFGVRIQNVEPSQEDVTATGRDYTKIEAKEVHGPIHMVVSSPKRF